MTTERFPVSYYQIGNNLMKDDNGVLYYLNNANVWQFSGRLLGYFMGSYTDDPELIPKLDDVKALYEKITGGKAWVP